MTFEEQWKLAVYQSSQNDSLELLRSVIAFSIEILKTAMLINGGGAVALLAFTGAVWSSGQNHLSVAVPVYGCSLVHWRCTCDGGGNGTGLFHSALLLRETYPRRKCMDDWNTREAGTDDAGILVSCIRSTLCRGRDRLLLRWDLHVHPRFRWRLAFSIIRAISPAVPAHTSGSNSSVTATGPL